MFLSELFQPTIVEGRNDPGIFKAIFMAGPPGAGKNTVIQKLGLNAAGLKLQDVDQTLAYLQKVRPEKANYNASLDTTKRRQSVYQQGGLGLIINTTGRDLPSLTMLNKKLEAAGYDTFMIFVDTRYEVAQHRIAHREKTATDPRDAGREVTPEYFDDAYDNARYNMPEYENMFGDDFALIINNIPLREDMSDEEYDFKKTMQIAAKKLTKFLRKPASANLVR